MSPRAITLLPRLSIRWHSQRRPYPFPLGRAGVSLWYNARAAIWQGVRQLGLRAGDRVLAPAYGCSSEVDALLKAGLAIDCYRVLPDLRPDLADAAARLDPQTRAFYVTHYFGLAQPMDEIVAFARERGLLVLEDASHGLYSRTERGESLGSLGDMSVFSFGKSLPIPDGGALVLALGTPAPTGVAPEPLTVAGTVHYLVEQALAYRFPAAMSLVQRRVSGPLVAWLKARFRIASTPPPADPALAYLKRNELKLARAGWRMSAVARLLLYLQCDATIPERRRRNFAALGARLEERDRLVPLLGPLPHGCCPLFFPVRTQAADDLQRFLAAHGVVAKRVWPHAHPAVPMERFPLERALKTSVVALPIHQDLDEADVVRIAALANRWARTSAAAA